MIDGQNFAQKSLSAWQHEFWEVYGRVDGERRPTEMWLLLVEDASRLAEAVRVHKFNDALDALAHAFCWTCSFASRCSRTNDLGIELTQGVADMVWHKYPHLCSACARCPCICPVNRGDIEEMSKAQRMRLKRQNAIALETARSAKQKMPRSPDGFQKMFLTIYRGAHFDLPLEAIAFHFLEEVGEVASCIRELRTLEDAQSRSSSADERRRRQSKVKLQTKELQDEIADVLSWCFSLTEKFDYLAHNASFITGRPPRSASPAGTEPAADSVRLSTVLWQTYRAADGTDEIRCPKCNRRHCECDAVRL